MKDEKYLTKSDNINFIKYIASIMVIVGHSFVISTTNLGEFSEFLNTHIAFGATGVAVFFFLSCLLVTQSMLRNQTGKKFFKIRIIRIFPPLIIVVIATIVMGAFTTNLSLGDYLLNADTLRYLLNIVLIRQHYLPGVFENNPYPGAVNGSLWTLLFEFICYILTYIVYKMRLLEKRRILFTIPPVLLGITIISMIAKKLDIESGYLGTIIRPCICYYMGMLLFFYHEYWINSKIMYVAIFLAIIGIGVHSTYMLLIFVVPIIILNIGWNNKLSINKRIAKLGKYSYGIYLVAFPIQQLLIFCLGEMSPFINCTISVFLATLLGKTIYQYIELPIGIRCVYKIT